MSYRVVPVPNRWLTIGWHRARLPLPVEVFAGSHDLYHASDFVLPPVRKARTLLTVHDLSFLTVPQCADASLRSYLADVVPRSVARADHILADSQATKDDLIRLLQTPADKVTVVTPGVDARFTPVDNPAELQRVRQRYNIGDKPFVLGVGTLEPRKNWPALIRAWTTLRQTTASPDRLVFAGGRGWLPTRYSWLSKLRHSGKTSRQPGSLLTLIARVVLSIRRFRLPIVIRRLRHPGAGGAAGHTGRPREQLIAARSSWRCSAVGR